MARTGGSRSRGGSSNTAQTVTIQLRADTKNFVAGVTAAANSARNAANQAARETAKATANAAKAAQAEAAKGSAQSAAAAAREAGRAAAASAASAARERVSVISGMTRAEKAAYREAANAAKASAGSITGVMQNASRTASVGWRDYASAVKSSVSSAASAAGNAFKNSNFGSAVMYNSMTTGIRAAFSNAKDSVAGAFSGMADRGRAMVSSVSGYFRQLGGEARTLAKNILSNREALDHISTGAALGGAALTAGFGYAVKQYADFDKAMSAVQAATHETAGNMEKLRTAAMKAGADTKYSGSEAANGIEELAKAGVETKDILSGGLDGALALAAAGNIEVGEAAELAATAMTQFGLKGSDIGHVADLLAAGAGKAQGSVGDLGYALKQSGLVAAQTGLSIEETTGTLAAFASAGLVGSDAGTSFKVMLQKLQNPSKEAAGLMAEYGISLYNAEGKFKGITAVAGDLKRGLQNLTPAQRDAALATIFGSDAVRAANVLYTQGQEGIQGWIDKTNDAGYAASTAAIQQNNLAGDIEKLGGAIDTIILSSSGGLSDFFRGLVQMATGLLDFMGKLPPSFLAVNLTVVGLTGVALLGVAAAAKFITAYQTMKATLASFSVSARTASASTRELAASTEGAAAAASGSKLGKLGATLGKIAGTAALAAEGIVLFVSAANTEYKAPSLDAMNAALKGTGGNLDQVNQKFKDMGGKATWAFLGLEDQVPKVNGLGEALVRLKADSGDALEGFSQWVSHTAGAKVGADALKESVASLDEALGGLYAENRGEAEKFFQSIVRETDAASEAQGRAKYTAQEYMQAFPKLKEAVENYASSLNVSLTDEEKYQVMLGEYPPKLQEAARAQDELKHSLEVQKNSLDEGSAAMQGLSGEAQEMAKWVEGAGSAVEDLDKGLKMLAGGFADSTKSMADYYKSMDDLSEAIQKNSAAYDGQTKTFDQTTKAGQKLNDAFAKMAQEGIQASSAVARQGGDYDAVRNHIHGVIDTLRQSALQMGLTSDEAEQLIHSIYAIPDRVSIDTWADTTAARVMTSLNNDIEKMPREVTIGTQVFGVDAATGKLKYLREVGDATNGNVNINAHADTEQAISALSGVINSANSIPAWTNTTANANTGQAFGQLGALANKANSVPGRVDTTANARTGVANSNINNYKSNLDSIPRQKTTTIAQIFERKMVDSVKKTMDHRNRSWFAHGGAVPGFASGGLIPGREPLSRWTDNVPAVTDAGSPLMVRSGEFIVNADATRKHRGLLERINSGDFVRGFSAGGHVSGRREFVAPAQSPDLYNQIVEALGNWRPMVNIDGRSFYGTMRSTTLQARR